MEQEIKLPDLGEDAPEEAQVSFWYATEGEAVEQGQDLVEMITDKAAFTLPSPAGGTLKRILVKEGETAKVGQAIAIVEA
jgi:2-oxoglutarate dehydrogenase E2 component (dihydrolipoamide succinyltransferase)